MTNPLTGLTFDHLTASQAREQRDVVEDIYIRSYVEAIASGDPFDSPAEFMRRFDAYTGRGEGFALVFACVDGNAAGQAWGWPLQRNARWWEGRRLDSGDLTEFTTETGSRTFALSEIMVCAEYAGRDVARPLQDELLRGRAEQRATLLVESDNGRAYRAYLKWGWRRVGALTPDWPKAPVFDVLIREPLG
ncbi:acetyltransferase [Nocardia jejuensis]|uniref:acetyltransferase n=1 Tax=Nocardia jejuensis TaxID=328049 RepID=UPI0008315C45|nr:acetyltransferase [Nocardia jejuensis]